MVEISFTSNFKTKNITDGENVLYFNNENVLNMNYLK